MSKKTSAEHSATAAHASHHASHDAHAAAVTVASSRQWLVDKAKTMARQGVQPRDIDLDALTAPLSWLRAKIEPQAAAFRARNAGLEMADAAIEIAADLLAEQQGMPGDARHLRQRPQSAKELQAEAIEEVSSMHAYIQRQARGEPMRKLARRFGVRSGNSFPELLADARGLLAAAGDPELLAAFDVAEIDLAALRAVEQKLAQVPVEDVSRDGANEEQLSKIDTLRLQLDAYYTKLGAAAQRVFKGDPDGRLAFLKQLPRVPRRGKSAGGSGEGTGEGAGSGADEPGAATGAEQPDTGKPGKRK